MGNRSKKWQKFKSWSMMFAGLPRKENAKLCNIHFCCCSDEISVLDMAGPIAQELTDLKMNAYDSLLM